MENAILQLYEQVEMYKISTPKYQELLRNFNDARDKFDKKLNDEEKETLENIYVYHCRTRQPGHKV